jgi:hypothetical protein
MLPAKLRTDADHLQQILEAQTGKDPACYEAA